MESNDKRRLRLNVMRDILESIPYENVIPAPIELPDVPPQPPYSSRPPRDTHYIVRDHYADKL